jgi:hypothetical protein
VNGFHRYRQFSGLVARLARVTEVPSSTLADSMSRSSVVIGKPSRSATGCAVSCARSSGEAKTAATGRPSKKPAAAAAIIRPFADRW